MLLPIILYLLWSTPIITDNLIPWPPKSDSIEQRLDHFSFHANPIKFSQRYLYEDKWAKDGSPILFYCGNENPIENFWNNTGFVFELGQKLNALVIFAEHRYYGSSYPKAGDAFSQPLIQFLSVEQALSDFAHLIKQLPGRFKLLTGPNKKVPVVAFGGSYGGILAAYMRRRYPNLIIGAIAASAPVRWVEGIGQWHGYFKTVTRVFAHANPPCKYKIRAGFEKIIQLTDQGRKKLDQLSQQFNLCYPLRSQDQFRHLLEWARNAFDMMAMLNYPEPADFMAKLPANPVNVACKAAVGESDLIGGLRQAVAVFYNSTGKLECFDYEKEFVRCADITGCGHGNRSKAWDFQCCTELTMHDGDNKDDVMFPPLPLSREQVEVDCYKRWKVKSNFDQLKLAFGLENFQSSYISLIAWNQTSNIVFSYGDLDPWMNGGITSNISDSVIAVKIHGGAHHLDLRYWKIRLLTYSCPLIVHQKTVIPSRISVQ